MEKNQTEKSKEWAKFLDLFLNVKDRSTLDMLFQLFMTMNERDMLADRYRLV
jgi:Trp operon repressor